MATTCPGCLAHPTEEPGYGAYEYAADALILAHGLARRPRRLDRQAQRDLLLSLAELAVSCRRDPEYGQTVRDLLRGILGGTAA
jgi:hypothetical protein